MREAVIIDAVRTPTGRGRQGGALSGYHPTDLMAHVLRGLVERTGVDPVSIDDVITGCVSQVGEQAFNIARHGALAAGFPETVPATSIDRQCGSSQQALHFAAQGVIAGAYDVVIAAGVESMSRVPMFSSAVGEDPAGPTVAARYAEQGGLVPQGVSAELIAAKWGLTREALDIYSAQSHQRAASADTSGVLSDQILPIAADRGEGRTHEVVGADEGVRPESTPQTLSGLKPAFYSERLAERYPHINWVVTAGGASQISDGAAALLLMERSRAEAHGLRPRAAVREFAVVGDDPVYMLTGVIPATEKVLARAGMTIDQIDAVEVNEAFAPVVLSWLAETGANPAKVNVRGGAIANGHPLGATGAKLMANLVGVLEESSGRFGLQVICEGGGMANATLIERL